MSRSTRTELTVRVTLDKDVHEPVRTDLGLGSHHARQDQRDREDDQRTAAVPPRARAESQGRDHAAEERAADRARLRRQLELDESERPDVDGRCGAAGGPDLLGRRQGQDEEHQLHAGTEDGLPGHAGPARRPAGAAELRPATSPTRSSARRPKSLQPGRLLRRADRHERRHGDAQPGHLHLQGRSAHRRWRRQPQGQRRVDLS